jgi:hypothetical protein
MLFSPLLLEEYCRERAASLSSQLALCRLAGELHRAPPPRWRRVLARRLASLSLCLDRGEAQATLKTSASPR